MKINASFRRCPGNKYHREFVLQVRIDFFRVYLSFHLKQQQQQQLFEWAKELSSQTMGKRNYLPKLAYLS